MEKSKKDLFEAIYDLVRLIPEGRVTSYGHIAQAIGLRSGARLVGYALSQCHGIQPLVPAHRVLNRNGLLTGKHHFGEADAMQQALEREGVQVVADKAVDFERLFWDPALEIGLE